MQVCREYFLRCVKNNTSQPIDAPPEINDYCNHRLHLVIEHLDSHIKAADFVLLREARRHLEVVVDNTKPADEGKGKKRRGAASRPQGGAA